MIVCGTGPLVAVMDRNDKHHAAATAFFDGYGGDIVVPSLIVAEICYLVEKRAGAEAEARFLDGIVEGQLLVADPTVNDWARMRLLVRQYAGFPLGAADASVIAIAERLGVTRVATIDHRHFRAVRPQHCDAFELLPYL